MLPSSTVENYLKSIYLGQLVLPADVRLVPMGQVAAALGVTPGTATTMVKALAESGLAEYEPYSGVRLTAAGEKLAGLVLRRHRLVELFLVQVMGMSWAEVHDEAEQLEHVVSERLIERIDEMLGRPTHDPHGDPIPTAEGRMAAHHLESLLTCPLGTPLKVTRIADQDPAFLRFIESNNLKPGQPIEVESRDAAADSVQIGGKDAPDDHDRRAPPKKLLVERLRRRRLHELADRSQIEVEVLWRQSKALSDLPHGFLETHQREPDRFDFLLGQRLLLHPPDRLTLHQPAQELHDRQHQLRDRSLHVLRIGIPAHWGATACRCRRALRTVRAPPHALLELTLERAKLGGLYRNGFDGSSIAQRAQGGVANAVCASFFVVTGSALLGGVATAPVFLGGARQHAIGRTKERRQANVNQIDSGNTKRDVTRCHDTLVQDVIQDVEQTRFWSIERRVGQCGTGSSHLRISPERSCMAATARSARPDSPLV